MTFDELIVLINDDDEFVRDAVRGVYALQEGDEKHARKTIHKNRVGFSCADAAFFSDCARYANEHGHLTPKQLEASRKTTKRGYPKLAKYHKQILGLDICGQKKPVERAVNVRNVNEEGDAA